MARWAVIGIAVAIVAGQLAGAGSALALASTGGARQALSGRVDLTAPDPTPSPVATIGAAVSPRGYPVRPYVPASAPAQPTASVAMQPVIYDAAGTDARLAAFPRPAGDNGWGVHWIPSPFQPTADRIDYYVGEARSLGIKWVKIVVGDEPKLDQTYLIRALVMNGMMPVVRVFQPRNEPYRHLDALVRLGVAEGAYYYELYNEPNIAGAAGGWGPGQPISVEVMLDVWIPAAEAVVKAGGYPSLPPPSPGGDYDDVAFLRAFLDGIRSRGRADLLQRSWIALHNYFLNHPLDYPYDEVNITNMPLTAEEIARRGLLPDEAARINAARRTARLPREQGGYFVSDNIYGDSNAFLKFVAYEKLFTDCFGYQIPILSTEGGMTAGSSEDPRYPSVTNADVASGTLAAYRYMLNEAPGYYFAFMPWLLLNRAGDGGDQSFEAAAWYRPDGTTLPVVAALKASLDKGRARWAGVSAAGVAPLMSSVEIATQWPRVREETVDLSMYSYEQALAASIPGDAAYPYQKMDFGKVGDVVTRTFRTVVLENAQVRLTIVPDLGGRILSWVDKTSGRNILYANGVVKPVQWGARGWWLAIGGMEWWIGTADRGLNESAVWSYSAAAQAASASVTVTGTEQRTGLVCQVTIGLDANHSYFTVSPRVTNPAAEPKPLQAWVNVMIGLGDRSVPSDTQILLPTTTARVQSSSQISLLPRQDVPWPMTGTVGVPLYAGWPAYQSIYAAGGAASNWAALVSSSAGLGVVRSFPADVARGVRFAATPGADPGQWSDDGGRFVELSGGLNIDAWTDLGLAPGTSVGWTERWYAVHGFESLNGASEGAALSLRPDGAAARVRLEVTAPVTGALLVWQNGRLIIDEPMSLATGGVVSRTLQGTEGGAWGASLVTLDGRTVASAGLTGQVASRPGVLTGLPPMSLATGLPALPLPPYPGSGVVVDPRLAALGVVIRSTPATGSGTYFRVKKLAYQDENESEGSHHIYVEVVDELGLRLTSQQVQVKWDGSQATLVTSYEKPVTEYATNFAMYGPIGSYSVKVGGASDEVVGMGLPGRLHVNFLITFQRSVR